MTDLLNISGENADLAAKMRSKLRVRGATLGPVLKRSKRRLPRHVKRAVQTLLTAEAQAKNPKLRLIQDAPRLTRARKDVLAYLDGVDPADERKGALLGILASLAVNFILLFVLVVAVLRWRGIV